MALCSHRSCTVCRTKCKTEGRSSQRKALPTKMTKWSLTASAFQISISEVLLVGWMVWQPVCMQSYCSQEVRKVEEVIIVRTAARYLSISPCSSISSATSSRLQWCEEACHHHKFAANAPKCFPPSEEGYATVKTTIWSYILSSEILQETRCELYHS